MNSAHWSGGEWLLILGGLFDLLVCLKGIGGSNPPERRVYMGLYRNAKGIFGRFLQKVDQMMSRWVVRAFLLSLGIWCAYPQPNAHYS